MLRCNKDGVKAALDKSFWEGIDVGNTDAMTNTISMEKKIEAVEAWVPAQDRLVRSSLGIWAGPDKMFVQLRPKAA